MGRWTASDPSGIDDGVNVYCYVHNNPVRLSDPDGRDATDHVNYLKGAGDALTKMATGGKTFGDLAKTYSDRGGGLRGAVAASIEANPLLSAASEAYRQSGGGVLGGTAAAYSLSPAGMMAHGTVELAKTAAQGYTQHGGGVEGVAGAVDAVNPMASIRESGKAAVDAMKAGDMRKSGEAVTSTIVQVGMVLAMFATGGGGTKGGANKTTAADASTTKSLSKEKHPESPKPNVTDEVAGSETIGDGVRSKEKAFSPKETGKDIVGSTHSDIGQTQIEIHPDIVQEYMDIMKAGGNITPIEVNRLPGGRLFLEEGHHRYVAGQKLGIDVPKVFKDGPGPTGMKDWSNTRYNAFERE